MGRVVHCKKEKYDVYIGRPGPWGNPFSFQKDTVARWKVASRSESIEKYRTWLWQEIKEERIDLAELASLSDKTLGCWCAPKECHGDVLLRAAAWAQEKLNQ